MYYIVNGDLILEKVEHSKYDVALEWRDMTAERLGVNPEALEVMTPEEYEEEW